MSKKSKKKVIVTTKKAAVKKSASTANTSKMKATTVSRKAEPMLFGKENYMLIGLGILLMTIGFILMLGGSMPDVNTWDKDSIYGFRRTVAAPFMILAGLVTLVFSIFKKSNSSEQSV